MMLPSITVAIIAHILLMLRKGINTARATKIANNVMKIMTPTIPGSGAMPSCMTNVPAST